MPLVAEQRRKKISATLSPDLIQRVTDYQREAGLSSFSAALEELLWRQIMEEKARDYYLSMSAVEREEQGAWTQFATEQFFKVNREE
ncbi:MAG: hypothetical protein ABSG54_13440 [Terriglobia bacterium]|jgi:hypothetical protein